MATLQDTYVAPPQMKVGPCACVAKGHSVELIPSLTKVSMCLHLPCSTVTKTSPMQETLAEHLQESNSISDWDSNS